MTCACGNTARYINERGELCCGICPIKEGIDSIKLSDVPLLKLAREYVTTKLRHHEPISQVSSVIIPRRLVVDNFNTPQWDRRMLELAQLVSTWSKDPRTKVGAVITRNDHVVVGLGYNGFPRHVEDKPERYQDSSLKYKMIVHAEANALLNANSSLVGTMLYTLKPPCTECTKLVIQAGIWRVVFPSQDPNDPSYQRWFEDMNHSMSMLREAGVNITEIEV